MIGVINLSNRSMLWLTVIQGNLFKTDFNLNILFNACPCKEPNVCLKDTPLVKTIPKYVNWLTIST